MKQNKQQCEPDSSSKPRLFVAEKIGEAARALAEGGKLLIQPEKVRLARLEEPEIFDAWRRLNDVFVAETLELAAAALDEARSAAGDLLEANRAQREAEVPIS
jgi:hypothetical protein